MSTGLLLSPVFPPARGGIETMCREITARGTINWSVLTLEEPAHPTTPVATCGTTVTRVRNIPRGGRRSIARLTARSLRVPEAAHADLILSMHVRCVPAAVIAHYRSRAPWFQYFHAKEVREYPRQARHALRWANGCFAVSRFTASLLEDLDPAAATRVTVVSPGVDAPGPARPWPAGRPTIVTIARMVHDYKGHDTLLDALEKLRVFVPDVRWVVLGDGPRRSWLDREVRRRGLEGHVVVRGAVDDDEREHWLRQAHVFALVSRTPLDGRGGEGFGIVYREAAALGVPAVAGSHGGVPDAVRDGASGLLVDPYDIDAVTRALHRVLGSSELGLELGRVARSDALAATWDAQVERIETVVLAEVRS